jgi:hypothetical protein
VVGRKATRGTSPLKKPTLLATPSAFWSGGFALEMPSSTMSVAAAGGTVLAACEQLHLLRPGATRFDTRDPPPDFGDIMAVAVEPRRRGRVAMAGVDAVAVLDGDRLDVVRLEKASLEFVDLAWGPAIGDAEAPLFIFTDDEKILRLVPGESDFCALDLPPVSAMACNESGALTFASFDEKDWSLDVHVALDPNADEHVVHNIEAPAFVSNVYLAVNDAAVAVGFEREQHWLTRSPFHEPVTRVKALFDGPVAFQGQGADAPLFGVATKGDMIGLLRIDANGDVTRIGELAAPRSDEIPARVTQLAWDPSRQALWVAAGSAGTLCLTAPGALHARDRGARSRARTRRPGPGRG